jgi:hypothetical protein
LRVEGWSDLADDEFSLISERFAWDLRQFVNVAPITEAERQSARQAVSSLGESVREFVDRAYTDTPTEVRAALCEAVSEKVRDRLAAVGDYFNPSSLYWKPDAGERMRTTAVETLLHFPLLSNSSTAFRHVAAILNDETLDLESRKEHVGHFVVIESDKIAAALSKVKSDGIDGERLYREVGSGRKPEEMEKAILELEQRRAARAAEQAKGSLQRRAHERLIEEIVEGSGVEPIGGESVEESASVILKQSVPVAPTTTRSAAQSTRTGAGEARDVDENGEDSASRFDGLGLSAVVLIVVLACGGGLVLVMVRRKGRSR